MDWGALIGPAVVAAGVSGVISVIGLIVSTRTARGIHTEKLAFDREVAGRKFVADEKLAERKFDFDNAIAERKFKYDRELHDHKRKTELAEQGFIAFHEVRDAFVWVRSPASFAGEGTSRKPAPGETATQQETRNTYFIPIERLNHDRALFAKLQSLRYAFAAHFGESAIEPFRAISDVHNYIRSAASVLIEITRGDDFAGAFQGSAPPLLDAIGWGTAKRPDDTDRKIDKAVQDVEEICRRILGAQPSS
jgi:hypothetical protein